MRRSVLSLGLSSLSLLFLAGCLSSGVIDTDGGAPVDGASPDATVGPTGDAATDAPGDTSTDAPSPTDAQVDASDAAIGPFLLLSYYYEGYSDTEYSAFNVTADAVQGGIGYAQYGINVSTNTTPWVLEQNNDLVLRMDPNQPWKPTSSWNVTEPFSTAFANTDAFAVAEVGTKAYVAGYATNSIAVLDTSVVADGGAPIKSISLMQFVTDANTGGGLEATSLAYDASQNRLWVVLANTNTINFGDCSSAFQPLVVAIDTTTDTVVPGVEYTLQGSGVAGPSAVAYDAKNDRLLVESQGCNDVTDAGDGGTNTGPTVQSYVESLQLGAGADAGADTILLNLQTANGGGLVYVDEHHAFVSTSNGVNAWDPTTTTLGAAIANAPDAFVWDGNGHLLGPQTTTFSDGGFSVAIVAVDPLDGGVTTLATNPFTPAPSNPATTYGVWQSVDLWPHP